MIRRVAALLVFLMLATILWLRTTPPIFVIAVVAVAAMGLFGQLRFDARRTRGWTAAVWSLGLCWVVVRALVAQGLTATFLSEAIFLVLATDLCRQVRSRIVPRSFAAMSLLTLVVAMQQRVSFDNLTWFPLLGMAVVLGLAGLAVMQRAAETNAVAGGRLPRRFGTRRTATTLAVVTFAAFASFKTSEAWGEQLSALENQIDLLLSNFVTDSIPRLYPRTGSLNSIRNEKLYEPDAVAIRIYSRKKPGYLTGRVFDGFNNRTLHWQLWSPQYREMNRLERLTFLEPTKTSGIRVPQGQKIFQVTQETPSRKLQIYEIENTSGRGEMVFTPQGAQFIRGYGRKLRLDDHGVVHNGINTVSKYVVYADPNARSHSLDVIKEVLLHVPDELRPDFDTLAKEITKDAVTFDQKLNAIKLYFADTEFKYSNKTKPKNVRWDQLLPYFVKTGKQGHCELFATSTVLMLRTLGIPARYVTGYVVDGRDPDDNDYWAALNRNCHAWAEAWNADEQRWEIVETTPGMNFATEERSSDSGRSDLEIEDLDEGATSGSTGGFSSQKWARIFQWTGLSLGSVFLIGILIRFSTRTGKPAAANEAILRLDRRLARQGIHREPGETLHEFADRIEQTESTKLPSQTRTEVATFYREYGSRLYAGNDSQLASLAQPVL